jgi:hypothetical protein
VVRGRGRFISAGSTAPQTEPHGQVLVSASAPATTGAAAPGFPPNYLGTLNPWTGVLTAVPLAGAPYEPGG